MNLEDIVIDFDEEDVTKPSHMDKILMLLERIEAQDDEFMELLVNKLRFESVTWEQPWYQKCNTLTRPLKKPENAVGLEDFRSDAITKQESLHIEKRWKKFRRKYVLPNTPECFARWKSKGKCKKPSTPEEAVRKYVVAYLAKGLQRSLNQVYMHICALYAYPNKRKYSRTEEIIMQICFHHSPSKAVRYLSRILGREPRGIYKRLNQVYDGTITRKPDKKRLKWTLQLASKFLKLLLKHTGENLEGLKYKHIDKSVWLKLQDDIDEYYVYLQSFWYRMLHVQLFVKQNVTIKKLRKLILKRIRSTYEVWTDIRWNDVLKYIPDGFTTRFLYRLIVGIMPKHRMFTDPLEDVVNEALRKNKNINHNRRLKTLVLNSDGDLEVVKYDAQI